MTHPFRSGVYRQTTLPSTGRAHLPPRQFESHSRPLRTIVAAAQHLCIAHFCTPPPRVRDHVVGVVLTPRDKCLLLPAAVFEAFRAKSLVPPVDCYPLVFVERSLRVFRPEFYTSTSDVLKELHAENLVSQLNVVDALLPMIREHKNLGLLSLPRHCL